MASYGLNGAKRKAEESEEPRSSMEYRKAFMEYVQTGKRSDILQFEKRADAANESSDLGVLLPQTVIQEIITGVEKIYGQLYNSGTVSIYGQLVMDRTGSIRNDNVMTIQTGATMTEAIVSADPLYSSMISSPSASA